MIIRALVVALNLFATVFLSDSAHAQVRSQMKATASVARITPNFSLRQLTIQKPGATDGARFYAGRFIFKQGKGSIPANQQSAKSLP